MRMLLIVAVVAACAGCAPTIVTRSVSVTTKADGSKETTETKILSQHIEIGETKSTKSIKEEFNK